MESGVPQSARQIISLYQAYTEHRADRLARIERVMSRSAAAGETIPLRAKRQANLGAALLALGAADKVLPMLRHSEDPTLRSYLIDRIGRMLADCKTIEAQIEKEGEVSIRRALIMALGGFDTDQLPPSERERLSLTLLEMYRNDPDPGVHSAIDWLLRRWGKTEELRKVDREFATGEPVGNRRWYVSAQMQTFIIVRGPVEFWTEDEKNQLRKQITHTFAVSSKETTIADFLAFRRHHTLEPRLPAENCPVNLVTWHDAVEYCNWLNVKANINKDQWCYVPKDEGNYAAGVNVAVDWDQRTGYRLPTREEWECMARAGAQTPWFCGHVDNELLGYYARFRENSDAVSGLSSCDVGTYKPNDYGVFDAHGNVSEWCQDVVARGGSYFGSAILASALTALRMEPDSKAKSPGFRVVRTMPTERSISSRK
jgi:formylglycine-generating enzyme required for sulfatase activity